MMNKKLCYMDTNNFIIAYIKADDVYKDNGDVETRFDTSIMNEINCYQKD